MSLDQRLELTLWQRWWSIDLWLRTAVVVWVLMTLAVCTRSAIMIHKQNVFPMWKLAGNDWLTSHDLYEADHPIRYGYRYGPVIATVFTIWDVVPERLGNIVWRLLNAGAFLAAFGWWLHRAVPLPTTVRQRGIMYLMAAPIALGSLNNGQPNLILIALMLAGVTALVVERWNLAAFCLAVAVLLKIYPLALVLLLFIVYPRRLPLRFLIALAVLIAVPFLMQHPDYVLRQYRLWYERVSHGDVERRFWIPRNGYRDIWMLIRIWELPISLRQYTVMQLAGGFLCAVFSGLIAWSAWPTRQRSLAVLTLGLGWMLLLGPSPESATFVLVAPVLVWWLFQTRMEQFQVPHYLIVQGWGLLVGCVIAGTSPIGINVYQAAGLQPLGVLLFAAGFLTVMLTRLLSFRQGKTLIDAKEPSVSRAA